VDELNAIDDVYLRRIESLYTWKTLVLERLRSASYSDTLLDTLGNTLPNILGDTLPDTLERQLVDDRRRSQTTVARARRPSEPDDRCHRHTTVARATRQPFERPASEHDKRFDRSIELR